LTFAALSTAVRTQLDQPQRYAHVVRVARLAERLAAAHGADTRRARLAGMLHDLARLYSGARLLDECARREMPIDAFERANPVVLHARLGAELARERFGVEDSAVLSAIRKHTLADPQMSALDECVYLADGLEPGREFASRAELEQLAFRDLAGAMRATLRQHTTYLERKGAVTAPLTLAAIHAYERSTACST
jgi:predicted HD superfamily hydrolase involved in NAD metabolism